MSELVTVFQANHYAVCTLTLPSKRNPISKPMRDALVAAMEGLKHKDEIRSVIITGSGNTFCSGMDLDELSCQGQEELSAAEHLADSRSIRDFFEYVYTYPRATIAAVNGAAVAGGCGLALVCDLTVAAQDAYFCLSEVKIGFVPALVSVYLRQIAGEKIVRELLLTARKVAAEEAKCFGLVNAVVPAAELLQYAIGLADQISRNGPLAVRATKELLAKAAGSTRVESLEQAAACNATARGTEECREGVRAFLEKRKPFWVENGG